MAGGAPLAITLAQRIGVKAVVTAGMAIIGFGLVIMAQIGVEDDYTRLAIALGTMGFGMGVTMAPATEAVMASLPPAKAGVGSAVNDTTRQVGGALDVAVLGSLLVSQFAAGLPATISGQPLPPEARTGVGQALQVAAQTGGDRGQLLAAVATQAFINALGTTVMVGALVAFGGAMVAAIWLPTQAASAALPVQSYEHASRAAVPTASAGVPLEEAWTAPRAKAAAPAAAGRGAVSRTDRGTARGARATPRAPGHRRRRRHDRPRRPPALTRPPLPTTRMAASEASRPRRAKQPQCRAGRPAGSDEGATEGADGTARRPRTP